MEFNKLNVGTIFFLTFCNRIHYLNSFKIISTISCYIFRLTIFHIDFYMKKKKKLHRENTLPHRYGLFKKLIL